MLEKANSAAYAGSIFQTTATNGLIKSIKTEHLQYLTGETFKEFC